MAAQSDFRRRALLRGGLSLSAAGALGLGTVAEAAASPARKRAAGAARADEPRILTNAEWGARKPSSPIVVLDRVPAYIVVHHTYEPGNSEDYSLEHAKAICRQIQNFHMDTNGWSDSGQQFTNSRGGFVLEGRHQSLAAVRGGTRHVQGANVGGHNSEVIGIENEGDYRSANVPQAQWHSLVGLVDWIADRYGTPAANIKGHRDFNSTACPGDVLYGRLQELRDAVSGSRGLPSSRTSPTWPLLRPGEAGPQVRAAQHLLRAAGFDSLPVDGVFGAETRKAVATLADRRGIKRHSCSAAYHRRVDETGYLGSDIWPLITPEIRPGAHGEIAKAVDTLHRSGARALNGTLGHSDWQRLLA